MSQYSTQGSVTIKRLRNGDSLFITLESNGIPLYQGVDTSSGAVAPNWTVAANQPVLTPKVTSSMGNTVVRSMHQWRYNGVTLLFTGATSGDWRTDSTGKFQLNISTGSDAGAIKIIANLANPNAVANGQLEYSCVATVGGVNYNVSKTRDVVIQNMGSSSAYGYIVASPEAIDSDHPTSTLKTGLQMGASVITSYHVKWWKDDTPWPAKDGQKQITVGRGDVDGTQLFIAEFYLKSTDTTPVCRAGSYIIDSLDEFGMNFDIISANKEVAPGLPVTVKGKIIKMRTKAVFAPANPVWRLDVMDKDTWAVIKTKASDTIDVTTTETDRNGKQNDVEVVGEVSWS